MEPRKRSAGAVTVRQLARETSAVLDRVREADAPIIVTRHGMPVAAIHPLDIDPWRGPKIKPEIPEVEEPEVDLEAFELDERMKEVLREIDEWFSVEDVVRRTDLPRSDARVVCSQLEMKGLASRGRMKYELTHTGRRVAKKLRGQGPTDRRSDAPGSRNP